MQLFGKTKIRIAIMCAAAALGGGSVLAATVVETIADGNFTVAAAIDSTLTFVTTATPHPLEIGGGENKYGVGTNPNLYHSGFIDDLVPYPNGAAQAMIVNGNDDNQGIIWQQTVSLIADQTYAFTGSATSIIFVLGGAETLADMAVELSDNPVSCATALPTTTYKPVARITTRDLTGGVATGDDVPPDWDTGRGNTSVTTTGNYCLRLRNTITASTGNDFALTALSLANLPQALADPYATPINTPLTGQNVGTNDPWVPISPTYTTDTTIPASQGSLVLNTDGSFTFTPALNFEGWVTFAYKVCSTTLNTAPCSSATATIKIGNPAPHAIPSLNIFGLLGLSALVAGWTWHRRRIFSTGPAH